MKQIKFWLPLVLLFLSSLTLPAQLLFYNANTGAGAITDAAFASVYSTTNLSTDWRTIAVGRNGLLFYNKQTGAATITNTTNLGTIRTKRFSKGWSHIIEATCIP